MNTIKTTALQSDEECIAITDDEALGEEYEVDIVSPREHNGSGFCWDETCPDREDQENIDALGQAVANGLITAGEADLIYHGHTV